MSFKYIDLYSGAETNKNTILSMAAQYRQTLPQKGKILIICKESNIINFLAAFLASNENHHFIIASDDHSLHLSNQFINQFNETINLDEIIINENTNHFHFSDLHPKGLLWIKTSGSTGDPKYFGHNFTNIQNSSNATINFLEKYIEIKNINWLLSLPLTHIGGIMILFRSWIHGLTTTYIKNLKSINFNKINKKLLPNFASLVPTQIIQVTENENLSPLKKSLRTINVSGAKITKNHLQLVSEDFESCAIYNTYGASETCSQIAGNYYKHTQLKDLLKKDHHLLYTALGDNKIESTESKSFVSSKSNFTKYFNGSQFIEGNGKVTLYDIIEKEDNYFYLKGRSDNTIISGGKNINITALSDKIFNYLQRFYHKKIIEIKLIGVDDKYWGQKLILFLQFNKNEEIVFKNQENIILRNLKDSNLFKAEEIPKTLYYLNNIKYDGIKPAIKDLIDYHLINQFQWVFFHGFMGNSDDFQEIIHCPSQTIEDFKIIDLKQITNIMKGPFDLESINQSIKDQVFEKNENTKPIVFLGYSMGARIMLSSLIDQSYPIERYFIVSSHLGDLLTKNEKDKRYLKDCSLLDEISSEQDFEDFIDNWYSLPLFNQVKSSKKYPIFSKTKLFSKLEEYKRLLRFFSVGKMPNFKELIERQSNFNHKISFITGETDKKYTTYAANTNYPHKIIKGHSHALLFETPEKLKESIISLISEDIHL